VWLIDKSQRRKWPMIAQTTRTTLSLCATGALALDARDHNVYLPWLVQQKQARQCVVVDANLRPSVMPDLPAYQRCVHAFIENVRDQFIVTFGSCTTKLRNALLRCVSSVARRGNLQNLAN
jgi:hypothetical protein